MSNACPLMGAGWLTPGMALVPRRRKFADVGVVLLPDGRIDVAGSIHVTPSEAARAITGQQTNGWWFFLVDKQAKRSLRDVRREYLESFADDVDEGEDDGEDEDDS